MYIYYTIKFVYFQFIFHIFLSHQSIWLKTDTNNNRNRIGKPKIKVNNIITECSVFNYYEEQSTAFVYTFIFPHIEPIEVMVYLQMN